MRWVWMGILTLSCAASAQAYTCDDVRALSADQRAYYIKVFNITHEQQERIRHECYGSRAHRITTASEEGPTGGIRRSEKDQHDK
jgi:hypothetical protein